MLVNFGLKIAIIGKPRKNFVCKIDKAMNPGAASRSQSCSQQYIVTNHFEVIMVTNSEIKRGDKSFVSWEILQRENNFGIAIFCCIAKFNTIVFFLKFRYKEGVREGSTIICSILTQKLCRYAGTVMEVYKVNEELNSQLREVSQFTAQFSAEAGKKYN